MFTLLRKPERFVTSSAFYLIETTRNDQYTPIRLQKQADHQFPRKIIHSTTTMYLITKLINSIEFWKTLKNVTNN